MEQEIKPGPGLKFAVGVRKGTPLDAVGIPYSIINFRGIPVAQFQNGAMARFVVEQGVDCLAQDGLSMFESEAEAAAALDPESAESFEKIEVAPEVRSIAPRYMVAGLFKAHPRGMMVKMGYAILENGRSIETHDLLTVGSGLREYLWIYEQLRKYNRTVASAFWEAWKIFRL